MHYLKFRCSRIILISFLLFSLTLTAFPAVDLFVSGLFFDGTAFPHDLWWQKFLQVGLGYFLCLSVGAVAALYAYNRLTKRNVCGVDGRRLLFVILVLVLGPGLIVNFTLKDNFGRARPRDVAEFGGTHLFTPAFVPSKECNTNCSFSSGDAAGGFFSLALAMALTRRRSMFLAGVALGAVVSIGRISSGAHFFSDTVVSFFVMLLVADILFFYVVLTGQHRERARLAGNLLKPTYRTMDALAEDSALQGAKG
jgi:lipid A 4'-phosphatase